MKRQGWRAGWLLATGLLVAGVGQAVDTTKPIMQTAKPAAAVTAGAPRFAAGAAYADALATGKTGIYLLGTTTIGRGSATTYGLLRDGRILDVASKSRGTWLARQPDSVGGLQLSGAKFDQLIALGGLDRNVEAAGAAKLSQFLQVAGLAATSSAPPARPVTAPCVSKPGMPCTSQPLTFDADRLLRPLGLLLERMVPTAVARDCGPTGCLIYFTFGEQSVFKFTFEYNQQGGYWGFKGFGFHAIFELPEESP